MDPTATPAAPPLETGPAPELALMRVRIVLVVGATFVIALFIGGAFVALGIPGVGPIFARLLNVAPLPSVIALSVAFAVSIVLVAYDRDARERAGPRDARGAARNSAGRALPHGCGLGRSNASRPERKAPDDA